MLAHWGTWPLSKIDHLAIQTWITGLGVRLAPATVAECRRLTGAVLRSAVRNRLIAHNPREGVRVPKRRRLDTDGQVIAREVFRTRLLPVVPERHRGMVAIAATAGLRWGEAAGVCADALDLDRAQVRVIRTVIEVAGHTSFKPFPKSAPDSALSTPGLAGRHPARARRPLRIRRGGPGVQQRRRRGAATHAVPVRGLAPRTCASRAARRPCASAGEQWVASWTDRNSTDRRDLVIAAEMSRRAGAERAGR